MTTPAQPFPAPQAKPGEFALIAYPQPGPPGREGPQGPPGPTGPASGGPVMWTGQGEPPLVIEGAKAGDTWLDTTTGDIYTLT